MSSSIFPARKIQHNNFLKNKTNNKQTKKPLLLQEEDWGRGKANLNIINYPHWIQAILQKKPKNNSPKANPTLLLFVCFVVYLFADQRQGLTM